MHPDRTSENKDRQQQDGLKPKQSEPRNVLTCLPLSYVKEAAAIAGGNAKALSMLFLLGNIATTTKQRCVRIHQLLIEKSLSSSWRRKIIKLWRDSDATECVDRSDYVIGSRSLSYQFKTELQNPNRRRAIKLRQLRSSTQQNSLSVAAPTFLPSVSEELGSLVGVSVIGNEMVDGVEFVWLEFDRALADCALSVGAEVLGWDRVKAISALGCAELVDECELDDADLATEARAAILEAGVAEEKVDRKVMAHLDAIKRFRSGKNKVRFSGGRIHNRLTALPGWYRDKYVGFAGGTDRLDIRGCYAWLVAADCLRMRRNAGDFEAVARLERLCELIESGKLYETIAASAGMVVADAKREFQRLCLFGRDVGRAHNRLWNAMMSLSPEWCGYVLKHREQRAGASRLAHRLMRMEGALICSGAALDLAEDGVKCATIHDGVWVPAGRGELAAMHIRRRAIERYGRAPGLKIERVGRVVEARSEVVVVAVCVRSSVVVNEFEEPAF